MMDYIKINVSNDEEMGKYIFGMFKSLAYNSKTKFTLEQTSNGIQFSKITGVLDDKKFVLVPVEKGSSNSYNIKVDKYEVDIIKSYNGVGLIGEKFTRVIDFVHEKIKREYIYDENSHKYYPRPKQPNIFQRFVQKLRGE